MLRNRLFVIILSVLLVGAAVGGYWWYAQKDQKQETIQSTSQNSQQQDAQAVEQSKPNSIRLVAVGDMLPHDTVNLRAENQDDYDYTRFVSDWTPLFATRDIMFCNQESPSSGGAFGISGYPSFNAPQAFSRDLENMGCNVINLANNHVADRGESGIDATMNVWNELNPLAVAGINKSQRQQNSVDYFEVKGVKFAFLAYTNLTNAKVAPHALNLFDESHINTYVAEATEKADYVIVSAHWGVEDQTAVAENQKYWANVLSRAGADLVVGTGPHVLQTVEQIGDTTVMYSLGNFLSSQLKVEELIGGAAVLDFKINDGGLSEPAISFVPSYMHYEWTPDEAKAEDFLARHNLQVVPLHSAQKLLARSLLDTSVNAQLSRIKKILNMNIDVDITTIDQITAR